MGVTSQSIFGGISNSIVEMLFGSLLLIGSIIPLFWNEGHFPRTPGRAKLSFLVPLFEESLELGNRFQILRAACGSLDTN
jgi:hypothetical protein